MKVQLFSIGISGFLALSGMLVAQTSTSGTSGNASSGTTANSSTASSTNGSSVNGTNSTNLTNGTSAAGVRNGTSATNGTAVNGTGQNTSMTNGSSINGVRNSTTLTNGSNLNGVQGTTGATSTNGTTVNGTSINTRPNGSTSSFVGAPASFNNPPVPSSVSKPADQTLTVSSMVGELQNANIQSINTTINVSNILTGTSMRSIDTELSANPAAVRQAERLTEILRTRGVIGSGQRVVGIYNGQAVVALTSTLTK